MDKNNNSTTIEKPLGDILIIAYGCEPNASSEPGVGWNFAREISSFTKIHVITRANNKARIEAALIIENQSMRDNITWHFIDIEPLKILKNKVPLGIQVYYALWQWKVLFFGRKLIKKHTICLCHHLTYGVMWLSPVTSFIMKPFIWGPIGGGDVVPWIFRRHLRLPNILQETLYAVMSYFIPRLSPLAIAARSRASTIIFRTTATSKLYPRSRHVKSIVMCETAIDTPLHNKHRELNNELQIVCIGRHTYWKGYLLAIKGFHLFLQNGGCGNLVFLGDGPELDLVKSYCNQNKLHDHVSLPGHVSHTEAQSVLDKSDILLHPSFRDGGSWSVLEAMEQGKAVICLNRSGLADMVDDTSGILIEAVNPSQVATDIGAAILQLDRDRALLYKLSQGAKDRVNNQYRWSHRREAIYKIYCDVLSK